MKYIYLQPAIERFEWELQTSIQSLNDLGVDNSDIIMVFAEENDRIPRKFRTMGVKTFTYRDDRTKRELAYMPSIRPYLWYKFLSNNKEYEKETFVYLDSDVIITDLEAFNVKVTNKRWYCSDASSYLNYSYLKSVTNADFVIEQMILAHGEVDLDWIKKIDKDTGGAQWVIKQPKAEYWKDVFDKSVNIWHATADLDTSLQKWTAEMWSQIWTMEKYGLTPKISKKMDFVFATDKLEDFKEYIIHNAGVVKADNEDGLFFKSQFKQMPLKRELKTNKDFVQSIYIDKALKALY